MPFHDSVYATDLQRTYRRLLCEVHHRLPAPFSRDRTATGPAHPVIDAFVRGLEPDTQRRHAREVLWLALATPSGHPAFLPTVGAAALRVSAMSWHQNEASISQRYDPFVHSDERSTLERLAQSGRDACAELISFLGGLPEGSGSLPLSLLESLNTLDSMTRHEGCLEAVWIHATLYRRLLFAECSWPLTTSLPARLQEEADQQVEQAWRSRVNCLAERCLADDDDTIPVGRTTRVMSACRMGAVTECVAPWAATTTSEKPSRRFSASF